MIDLIKKITKEPLFIVGILIRLPLLFIFSSNFLDQLFIPFIDQAVLHPLSNPWELSSPESFPYGSILFLIFYIPKLLGYLAFGSSTLGSGLVSIFLMKLPLFILEIGILSYLISEYKPQTKRLLLFFWLNPILIYITYLNVQLDLVVIALLILSIGCLNRRRIASSALLLAGSLLCKFHVILVVPLFLVYIWNTEFTKAAVQKIITWSVVFFGVGILGFLPHLFSGKFTAVSTQSPESGRLFAAQISYGNHQVIYVGALLLLLTIGRLVISTKISYQGLLFGCGFIMGTLLAVTNPIYSWFYWFVPFVALFHSLYTLLPTTLFVALNIFYFLYFVLLNSLQIPPPFGALSLTLLQSSVIGYLFFIYQLILRHETPIRGRLKPLVIGLAGDSGSGKDHFASTLKDIFTNKNTVFMAGDDYHRWERGHEQWKTLTHLNPSANNLKDMSQHAKLISRGIGVFQPHYDHNTGLFTLPKSFSPKKTVILQGLHTLYPRDLRKLLNLKIFLSPDETLRTIWKTRRDTIDRGHSTEKVLESLKHRMGDSEKYIIPQGEKSDWIIRYRLKEPLTADIFSPEHELILAVDYVFWNDAPIATIFEQLAKNGVTISTTQQEGDINRIVISVSSEPSLESIVSIASNLFLNLRQITRAHQEPVWRPGFDGINQLILIALIDQ